LAVTTPLTTAAHGIWVQVGVVAAGDTYRIIIDGNNHDHIALAGDTALTILTALRALIMLGPVTALVDPDVMTGEDTLQILVEPSGTDPGDAMSFALQTIGMGGGTLITAELGGLGYLTCQTSGPQEAPAGTLTDILDPVAGWQSVHQTVDADAGSDIETDAALRLRRERSIHVSNGGTVDAIRTALLELDDVDEAIVLENVTDVVDGLGVPPHAIYAILDAPNTPIVNAVIGETIFKNKPGGIATFGPVSVNVIDEQGFPHVIDSARVIDIPIYLEVQYHIYSEEDFPSDGEDGVATACQDYGETLAIGKDLMPHRLFGPIFEAVPGIEWLIVGASIVPGGPFLPAAIAIAADRRATIDDADVTCVLVP
jgi:hypothetical protein